MFTGWEHYDAPGAMPFSRFKDIPAVHEVPQLSPTVSRSPSIGSMSDGSTSPCTDRAGARFGAQASGCHRCESSHRALQRENHDLRKLLGQLKQRLAFTQQHLDQEQAKQDVLQQTVSNLQASLDEVRARSLDVLEENLSLRVESQKLKLRAADDARSTCDDDDAPASPLDVTHLDESPLDRQLRAASRWQQQREHGETSPRPVRPVRRCSRIASQTSLDPQPRRNAISATPDSYFARSLTEMSSRLSGAPPRPAPAPPTQKPHQPPPPQEQQRRSAADSRSRPSGGAPDVGSIAEAPPQPTEEKPFAGGCNSEAARVAPAVQARGTRRAARPPSAHATPSRAAALRV